MLFSELKIGTVVYYNKCRYRGIVTGKSYVYVCILWAISESPEPVEYTISDIWLFEQLEFYAFWYEFNTVPVKTINTLNNF